MSTRIQNASTAKLQLREAIGLLRSNEPSDEHVRRALKLAEQAVRDLDKDLSRRDQAHARRRRQIAKRKTTRDVTGRRRSPAAMPGYHAGRVPATKGKTYPPTPPSIEECVRMLSCCDGSPHGERRRVAFLLMWGAGLRCMEMLGVYEDDLDPDSSSIYIRRGKGGDSATVGLPRWVWPLMEPWIAYRRTLPYGPLVCVLKGPTAGAAWASSGVRLEIGRLGKTAGVRRRVAPHQLRHAHAVYLLSTETNLLYIQRQLRHADLGVTTRYLKGVPSAEGIRAIAEQRAPQVSALSALAELEHRARTMMPVALLEAAHA